MEQEHMDEWLHLEDAAIKTLRSGNHKEGKCLLQLLILPSFEPAVSYQIYELLSRHQLNSYLAVIIRWRKDTDLAKFRDPVERLKYPRPLNPTIESESFELTPEFVSHALSRFRAISIPVLTDTRQLGLDGIDYEVQLGNNYVWSRFH